MGIVESAQKYLGTPYVWGGESMEEGGMDCSGFVTVALQDAGVPVQRTTAQGLRQYGVAVDKSQWQPGDVLFFGSGSEATHVGIYVGNGQMIHSSGGSRNTKYNPGKGVSFGNANRSDLIEVRRMSGVVGMSDSSGGVDALNFFGKIVSFLACILLAVMAVVLFAKAFDIPTSKGDLLEKALEKVAGGGGGGSSTTTEPPRETTVEDIPTYVGEVVESIDDDVSTITTSLSVI